MKLRPSEIEMLKHATLKVGSVREVCLGRQPSEQHEVGEEGRDVFTNLTSSWCKN